MFDRDFYAQLIQAGMIDAEKFRKVSEQASQLGCSVFELLISENVITESQLVQHLAKSRNIVFLDKITENMVDTNILAKIPFKFLRQNISIPVNLDNKLSLAISNPKDMAIVDEVSLLAHISFVLVFAPRQVILDAINKYYPFDMAQKAIDQLEGEDDNFALEEIKEQDLLEISDDAPVVKLVNHVIVQAIKDGASDIHIEPFEKELRVRYRIDGVMYQKFAPPKRYLAAIVSRIKIMSNLNIAEKRIPQDGRIQIRVADKQIDLRVSILPCNFGERVVMRVLDKSKGVVDLEQIAFSPRDYKLIARMVERPNGIILVSGPTGSGKTTTLYSVLSRLNNEDSNIITVEDPVEYTINGINQVQVNVKTGLTFASALRSILRQDPDIALIGEIRDGETAQIATQAALTGHLVLSTIHTNSAPATVSRLIDMDVEPFLIASSLICVIAQRLVRSLCQDCKQEYQPDVAFLEKFGMDVQEHKLIKFYKATGCDNCFKTGYKGRIPLFEVMEVNDEIASLIIRKADVTEIRKASVSLGMTTLSMDGIEKAKQGLTTLEEIFSVAFVDS